jgi:predicted glycosyltransferase
MYLFYVYGSGLGHLKRVSDFIHFLKIPVVNCLVISQSDFGFFWRKDWVFIQFPKEKFENKNDFNKLFDFLIKKYNISEVFIDVFPEGFYGELSSCLETFKGKKSLIARILSEEYFVKYKSRSFFDKVFFTEKGIIKENYNFKESVQIDLEFRFVTNAQQSIISKPFSIIIHSQPKEEVLFLYRLSKMYNMNQNTIIYTCSDLSNIFLSKNVKIRNFMTPSKEILTESTQIYTSAGFNSIRMLKDYYSKTLFVPFPRKYDDQVRRKKLFNLK